MIIFLVLPYEFTEDGDTEFVCGPVYHCAPFQTVLKNSLQFFVLIYSCLVLIFHLIVFSDHLEVVSS